jgi:hypothetical protein
MPDALARHDLVQVRPLACEQLGGGVFEVAWADDKFVKVIVGFCTIPLRREDVALVGRVRWTVGGEDVAR